MNAIDTRTSKAILDHQRAYVAFAAAVIASLYGFYRLDRLLFAALAGRYGSHDGTMLHVVTLAPWGTAYFIAVGALLYYLSYSLLTGLDLFRGESA